MIRQLTNARYSATQQICPKRWLAEALITPSHRNSHLSQAECYLTSTLKKKLLLLAVSFLLHQKLFFHQTFFDIWSRRHGISPHQKRWRKKEREEKRNSQIIQHEKLPKMTPKIAQKVAKRMFGISKKGKAIFVHSAACQKFFAFILLSRR